MRKLIVMLCLAAALMVGVASGAQAAGQKAHRHARCAASVKVHKNQYLPMCTNPRINFKTPSAQCVKGLLPYKLPELTFVSNAGIRSIRLELIPPHLLKLVTFSGEGKTQYRLKGFTLNLHGLKAGVHHIKVQVKDVRGKTVTKTLRFTVCTVHTATPVFTG